MRAARLTAAQKQRLTAEGLNPALYWLLQEQDGRLLIVHKLTGAVRLLQEKGEPSQ